MSSNTATASLLVRLPAAEKKAIRKAAAAKGQTLTSYVRLALQRSTAESAAVDPAGRTC